MTADPDMNFMWFMMICVVLGLCMIGCIVLCCVKMCCKKKTSTGENQVGITEVTQSKMKTDDERGGSKELELESVQGSEGDHTDNTNIKGQLDQNYANPFVGGGKPDDTT